MQLHMRKGKSMPSQNLTNKTRSSRPGGRSEWLNPAEVPVGVIGLGLMGTSIIACLLAAGHPVVAVTRSLAKHPHAKRHALELLRQMAKEGLLKRSPDRLIQNFTVSEDYASLADRQIVIE